MTSDDGLSPDEIATADQMIAEAKDHLGRLIARYRKYREWDADWKLPDVGLPLLFTGQIERLRPDLVAGVLAAALERLAGDDNVEP